MVHQVVLKPATLGIPADKKTSDLYKKLATNPLELAKHVAIEAAQSKFWEHVSKNGWHQGTEKSTGLTIYYQMQSNSKSTSKLTAIMKPKIKQHLKPKVKLLSEHEDLKDVESFVIDGETYLVGDHSYRFTHESIMNNTRSDDSDVKLETFKYEGNTYEVQGMISLDLVYNETTALNVNMPMGVIFGFSGVSIGLWNKLIAPALAGIANLIQDIYAIALNGPLAATRAAILTAQNLKIVGFLGKALQASALVILIAIPIIIGVIMHPTAHTVQLVNLTDYKIKWDNPYMERGSMSYAPAYFDENDNEIMDYEIPGKRKEEIPGIETNPVWHYADFRFSSNTQITGVHWAMPFTIKDKDDKRICEALVACWAPFEHNGNGYSNRVWATMGDINAQTILTKGIENTNAQSDVVQAITPIEFTHGGKKIQLSFDIDSLGGPSGSIDGMPAYLYHSKLVFSEA
jgi:hypothetical protein